MIDNIFKERLIEFRKSKNLTQKEMADKLGVTAATFSAYEKGKNMPTAQILIKLSDEYGVSVDWLLGIEIEKEETTYADLLKLFLKYCEVFQVTDYCSKGHVVSFRDNIEDAAIYNEVFISARNDLYYIYNLKQRGILQEDYYEILLDSFFEKYKKYDIEYGLFDFESGERTETDAEHFYSQMTVKNNK